MSADVFTYNAVNIKNKELRDEVAAIQTQIDAKNTECAGYQSTLTTAGRAPAVKVSANHCELWSLIPTTPEAGPAFSSGTTVCDTTGNFRCGASCTYTIPAGATCARFQVWGSGGNSPGSCCCSFSIGGGSGAYASVIMAVTAGDDYVLCAGCAYCCYADAGSGQYDMSGCQSYVTGNGLTNFCAMGGLSGRACLQMKARCQYGMTVHNRCGGLMPNFCYCCQGTWLCTTGSQQGGCNTDHKIGTYKMWASNNRTYYGTATGATVYGIDGMLHQFNAARHPHCLCVLYPPVYGFESSSQCSCIFTNNGQAGCNRKAGDGYMQIPAAGGMASYGCANCNNIGDAGRMGMVCVQVNV